jgi:transposase
MERFQIRTLPKTEKKIMAVAMLAEGNSIRSIERMTGVHRDTIMRLAQRDVETLSLREQGPHPVMTSSRVILSESSRLKKSADRCGRTDGFQVSP